MSVKNVRLSNVLFFLAGCLMSMFVFNTVNTASADSTPLPPCATVTPTSTNTRVPRATRTPDPNTPTPRPTRTPSPTVTGTLPTPTSTNTRVPRATRTPDPNTATPRPTRTPGPTRTPVSTYTPSNPPIGTATPHAGIDDKRAMPNWLGLARLAVDAQAGDDILTIEGDACTEVWYAKMSFDQKRVYTVSDYDRTADNPGVCLVYIEQSLVDNVSAGTVIYVNTSDKDYVMPRLNGMSAVGFLSQIAVGGDESITVFPSDACFARNGSRVASVLLDYAYGVPMPVRDVVEHQDSNTCTFSLDTSLYRAYSRGTPVYVWATSYP